MEVIKFNINNQTISELDIAKINSKEFQTLKEKIIHTFNLLNYPKEDMSIYYERHSNCSSILAIKLSKGNDEDTTNYMINICKSEVRSKEIICDIGYHANAKISKRAVCIANLITKDIITFFETVEQELLNKNLHHMTFSVLIPLEMQKTASQKKNKLKIRSLLSKTK